MGHDAGDELIRAISRRVASTVAERGLVARMGGDEFAVLVTSTTTDEAVDMARRILDAIRTNVSLRGSDVLVSASVGVATTLVSDTTAEDLLRNADIAMYEAKKSGKGVYRLYERAMHDETVQRIRLESDLMRALGSDQF